MVGTSQGAGLGCWGRDNRVGGYKKEPKSDDQSKAEPGQWRQPINTSDNWNGGGLRWASLEFFVAVIYIFVKLCFVVYILLWYVLKTHGFLQASLFTDLTWWFWPWPRCSVWQTEGIWYLFLAIYFSDWLVFAIFRIASLSPCFLLRSHDPSFQLSAGQPFLSA